MQGLLYGTPTNDPVEYTAVSVVAMGVALLASYVPATSTVGGRSAQNISLRLPALARHVQAE